MLTRERGDSYPPDNDDKKKQLGDFFGTFPPPKIAGQVPEYVKAVKERDSSIQKLGILGVSCPPASSQHMTIEKLTQDSVLLGRQGRHARGQGVLQRLRPLCVLPPGHGRPRGRRGSVRAYHHARLGR